MVKIIQGTPPSNRIFGIGAGVGSGNYGFGGGRGYGYGDGKYGDPFDSGGGYGKASDEKEQDDER